MGFKRPEVQIFSPRPEMKTLEALYCLASRVFITLYLFWFTPKFTPTGFFYPLFRRTDKVTHCTVKWFFVPLYNDIVPLSACDCADITPSIVKVQRGKLGIINNVSSLPDHRTHIKYVLWKRFLTMQQTIFNLK
jgi:hypothetical protein